MSRLLFLFVHSTEVPERTVMGLRTARAVQQGGQAVDLWLTAEGARLGVKAVAETLSDPGDEQSAVAMLEGLVDDGARLFVDRPSFDERHFTEDALREGATLTPPQTLGELVSGDHVAVTL